MEGKGCVRLQTTPDIKGRCGVYEVFPVICEDRDQILDRSSTSEIKNRP